MTACGARSSKRRRLWAFFILRRLRLCRAHQVRCARGHRQRRRSHRQHRSVPQHDGISRSTRKGAWSPSSSRLGIASAPTKGSAKAGSPGPRSVLISWARRNACARRSPKGHQRSLREVAAALASLSRPRDGPRCAQPGHPVPEVPMRRSGYSDTNRMDLACFHTETRSDRPSCSGLTGGARIGFFSLGIPSQGPKAAYEGNHRRILGGSRCSLQSTHMGL
jgi:hypothetical protein